jgi:hypothetical protein
MRVRQQVANREKTYSLNTVRRAWAAGRHGAQGSCLYAVYSNGDQSLCAGRVISESSDTVRVAIWSATTFLLFGFSEETGEVRDYERRHVALFCDEAAALANLRDTYRRLCHQSGKA